MSFLSVFLETKAKRGSPAVIVMDGLTEVASKLSEILMKMRGPGFRRKIDRANSIHVEEVKLKLIRGRGSIDNFGYFYNENYVVYIQAVLLQKEK